ncbi:MAG: 50S ribosomal protein L25 [Syntrophomonadaceae bacterium]|nr:50S ribosomal protein L25 [Syntrophomonadaceae bacterium]MDD3023318.1 50S ribosomal protein L25 [Syntrophomonadaceae bacterium]
MASAPTLYGKKRELSTNSYLKQMKRDGWVPGVIYGKDKESQAILMEAKELKRVFKHTGTRGVFMLQIEEEKTPVMALIREIQKNPIGEGYTHIDFLRLKSNEKVHNKISIHLLGEDELITNGKLLLVVTKEMEISCLPADIPERISYDVSALNSGDKVTIADIKLPSSVELIQDPSTVICSVAGQSKMDDELEPENTEEEASPE